MPRTAAARFMLAPAIAVFGILAASSAVGAGSGGATPPPAAIRSVQSANAQLTAENARLRKELAMTTKFAPHQQAWWEQNFVQSIVGGILVGLLLAAVGARYSRAQARAGLTIDLLKLWLDVWSASYANGIVPLKVSGLDIDQPALEALEKLGNFYEIIATAVAAGTVDAPSLERYGVRVVNREFRALLSEKAALTPGGGTQPQARDALAADLSRWNEGANWA